MLFYSNYFPDLSVCLMVVFFVEYPILIQTFKIKIAMYYLAGKGQNNGDDASDAVLLLRVTSLSGFNRLPFFVGILSFSW